jgi:hypothetical protein
LWPSIFWQQSNRDWIVFDECVLFQLTKRDMVVVVFQVLSLLGLANWILHLRIIVAGASPVLSAFAADRYKTYRIYREQLPC